MTARPADDLETLADKLEDMFVECLTCDCDTCYHDVCRTVDFNKLAAAVSAMIEEARRAAYHEGWMTAQGCRSVADAVAAKNSFIQDSLDRARPQASGDDAC